MELGDLIYILIGVVVLVYSLIKKAKTKEQPEAIFSEYEADNTFDNVFQPSDVLNERPKITPFKTTRIKDREALQFKHQRVGLQNRIEKRKTIESKLSKRNITNFFEEDEKQDMINIREEDLFDLQKAVIYSEILKRPEFDKNLLIR